MTGNGRVPADSGYPEPGGRAPAPPPLRLAQVFVNTADREAGADALQSPGDLVQWLAAYDLLDARAPAGPDDIALALDLREGCGASSSATTTGRTPAPPTRTTSRMNVGWSGPWRACRYA